MNLYVYDLASKATRKLTDFAEYDIKFPSLGPKHIVFENGGYIYTFDLATEQTARVPVVIADDMVSGRGRVVKVDSRITNFEIGRRIVEFEQQGSRRAEYGERIVRELSQKLTAEFGRGFSKRNLEYIRRFYLEYHDVSPQIAQTLSAQLPVRTQSKTQIVQTLSAQFTPAFTLSWSHYIVLMNIDNRDERRFYEIESRQNQWSLSELKRQFNSGIYERLALSRDKKGVKALANKGQLIKKSAGRAQRSLCS